MKWIAGILLFVSACAQVKGPSRITVGGIERTYDLHHPKRTGSLPLFILLHGRGGSGAGLAAASGMNALADREGFIAVYPNALGSPSLWNAVKNPDRADDVEFIRALLAELRRAHGIGKVFVGGYSSGGYMTHTLGAELGNAIDGMAVISGASDLRLDPRVPLPLIAFHGMKDKTVSYPAARTAIAAWIAAADAVSVEDVQSREFRRERFQMREGDRSIEIYSFKERGHGWPAKTGELSTLDLIWRFLKSNAG